MEISQKSSLVHLKVESCTFEDKQLLTINNLFNLEKLVLDDSSINNLNELFKALKNTCSKTLKHLELSDYAPYESVVKEIVKKFPKLELLYTNCRNMSMDTIVSIAKIVRNRKNNTLLTPRTRSELINNFHELVNKSFMSSWLNLETSRHADDITALDAFIDFDDDGF